MVWFSAGHCGAMLARRPYGAGEVGLRSLTNGCRNVRLAFSVTKRGSPQTAYVVLAVLPNRNALREWSAAPYVYDAHGIGPQGPSCSSSASSTKAWPASGKKAV